MMQWVWPRNDWIPYQYDSPLHLVSECDGCRVMGTHKIEFVQRVPQSVESIFSIGSYDNPALLLYALEQYEKGDVCAQDFRGSGLSTCDLEWQF